MDLDHLAHNSGEWLRGTGPDSDIVISSRIRLARNLADFPFISRASKTDRVAIEKDLHALLHPLTENATFNHTFHYTDLNTLNDLDRSFLVERHLISHEHAEAEGARSVFVDGVEQCSIMINEEDHLRIQSMHSGFDLQIAWEHIDAIDNWIESKTTYAYSDKLGYLTACPTNVGTGLRVSVMLHLPALVITHQIEKVFRSLHKINLAVRGLYGEGSQAIGDFYQISNQITLGQCEEELMNKVADTIPVLIEYEKQARHFLLSENQETLHDRVSRAYGILSTAQKISSEETMHLLSSVRMGINLGLITDVPLSNLNKLVIHTQPAHLQKISGVELDQTDRDIERAKYLRQQLEQKPDNSSDN